MNDPDCPVLLACAEIPVNQYREIIVGNLPVLVCHLEDGFYAIEGLCSHQKKPLAGGRILGDRFYCPHHAAAFDIRTGKACQAPAFFPLKTFPLVIDSDGHICLQISDSG